MFSALLLLLACGEEDPVPTPAAAFQPTSGAWTIDTYTVVSDACGIASEDLDLEGSGFDLTDVDPSGFVLEVEVDLMTDCRIGERDFLCDDMVLVEDLNPDVDAAFVITFVTVGTFVDAGEIDAVQVLTVDCEGPECAAVDGFLGAELPCDIEYDMNATSD